MGEFMSTPKRVKSARIVNHGVEHEQYFQGHGVAFTKYDTCATGIGNCEKEAYDDALEQMLCSEEIDASALYRLLEEDEAGLSDKEPEALTEAIEAMDAACDAHCYVSIDVEFEKGGES